MPHLNVHQDEHILSPYYHLKPACQVFFYKKSIIIDFKISIIKIYKDLFVHHDELQFGFQGHRRHAKIKLTPLKEIARDFIEIRADHMAGNTNSLTSRDASDSYHLVTWTLFEVYKFKSINK